MKVGFADEAAADAAVVDGDKRRGCRACHRLPPYTKANIFSCSRIDAVIDVGHRSLFSCFTITGAVEVTSRGARAGLLRRGLVVNLKTTCDPCLRQLDRARYLGFRRLGVLSY